MLHLGATHGCHIWVRYILRSFGTLRTEQSIQIPGDRNQERTSAKSFVGRGDCGSEDPRSVWRIWMDMETLFSRKEVAHGFPGTPKEGGLSDELAGQSLWRFAA